jgi:hypothetical protein
MKVLELRFFFLISALLLNVCIVSSAAAFADSGSIELLQLLPGRMGAFRQLQPIGNPQSLATDGLLNRGDQGNSAGGNGRYSEAVTEYISDKGDKFLVEVVQFGRDVDAYSLLTIFAKSRRERGPSEEIEAGEGIGTASFIVPGGLAFFKGRFFVSVSRVGNSDKTPEAVPLAHLLAELFDKGEADIPVLVKHLPNWQDGKRQALYLPGFTSLTSVAMNQPVLATIDSAGDADAVIASYGQSQLLIVEFNTPQLASDNDRRIASQIQELRSQGRPVPTAYRRVGNYSVFVFNGDGEQTANSLIDQIKYEQVVQWLGDNPYLFQEAQRRYTETTLGVFVSVVKASGLAFVSCFAVGGLFGALLFARRRAQQKALEAYSDAGGMLRLNLDEMTPQTNPGRLVGRGHAP